MLFGGTNSGVALALAKVAQEKKRVYFNSGAGASALTNEQCTPYTIHYTYDTVALAKGTGGAVVDNGGKEWFFLTADYAFGHSLENDTAKVVKAKGGTVKGSVRHPLNASDFSSFLLQAQNSKAQILGLANAGGDTINAIKAAREFGINKSMKMAGLLVFLTDIHSLGLKNTEGLLLTTSWDWNLNDETRAFGKKFEAKTKRMPTDVQAANYSATMNYLKAVEKAGTVDADKVMAVLKSPYTIHYAYDTVALAKGTGGAVVDRGGKDWFFLTADYAFGQALEADTTAVIKAKGGTVKGSVKHPLNASDFSSFLLQAQSSKAHILGLANAGGDTINAIKAAKEFGIDKSMKTAGLLVFLTDIHSLGLKNTAGLLHTTSWYWDMNDESRKFANKFFAKTKRMPTDVQAADYSAIMQYLKAVQAVAAPMPTRSWHTSKAHRCLTFTPRA